MMGRLHPVVSPGVGRSFPPAVPFCFLLVQNKRMKEILPNKYKKQTKNTGGLYPIAISTGRYCGL